MPAWNYRGKARFFGDCLRETLTVGRWATSEKPCLLSGWSSARRIEARLNAPPWEYRDADPSASEAQPQTRAEHGPANGLRILIEASLATTRLALQNRCAV